MGPPISSLIASAERGDRSAVDTLFTALYSDLHRLAKIQLARNGAGVTLGVTTLLHEAYLDISQREAAEDAALAPKALLARVTDQAGIEQLHRGLPLEAAVAAPGEPHAAHPTLPDERDHRVSADRLPGQRSPWGWQGHAAFEEAFLAESGAFGEERPEFGGEGRVLRAERLEPREALVAHQLERLFQIGAEDLPAFLAESRQGFYPRAIT